MDDNGPVQLPTELLHGIVDTVAEDDDAIPTLTAITQTSRAMRPRAQKHIYETIELEITDKSRIDALGQIHATDSTVLAEHPRTLKVYDSWGGDLASVPILETIISHMRNLRAVAFVDLDVVGRPFTDSFASPSKAHITSIELRHVTLTFRALNSFISSPCLTELFLVGLDVVEYESAPDAEHGTDFSAPDCSLPQPQSALRCPLKELRLNISTTSDLVIMDLIATSRYPIIAEDSLVKVNFSSMYSDDNHVPLFQRFLDCKAIKSAKTLHLGDHELSNFTEQDSTGYGPLRFDTFETVELRVGIGRDWVIPPEFQWWANSLSAVPAGSPLKKLRLIITFHKINVQTLPDVTMNVWVDLDHALCGDNLELEHLAIDIATSVDLGRREESVVKRWFFDCLPGTHEKYFAEGTRKEKGSLNVSRSFEI
ncbi:uncharacterized protein ARMOST_16610 [Armillaria ostoyae]|uniref:F-box domain-containing protein n=1 Tax=Armillaria ostoyae TaxID=47428 RepID=A0A284RWQ0_ARMOS|nr:uncharacterized protein ARMOST_16610 [Armillaria ostoyae]